MKFTKLELSRVFFISLISFMTSLNLFAAKVTKVNKKKGYVYINKGSTSGFKSKKRVCFETKRKKKLGCGVVVKASKTKATIKISKKRVTSIKKGYLANLYEKKDKKEKSKKEEAAPVQKGHSMALKVFNNVGVLPQFSYNNLSYKRPVKDNVSLWDIESPGASGISLNLGAEFELVSLNAAVGFYLMLSGPAAYPVETSCCESQEKYMLTTTQTDSAMGVYADYFYLTFSSIKLGAGLEFFLNQVSLTAVQKNDNDSEIVDMYSTVSTLSIITLRLPVYYELSFGSFGIYAGAIVKLPLVPLGPTPTNVLPDPPDEILTKAEMSELDLELDLNTQLLHTKGSFSADISFGIFYAL